MRTGQDPLPETGATADRIGCYHPWVFVVTGSAGWGKNSALRKPSARRDDLALFDFDDLRPPPDAGESWPLPDAGKSSWRRQIEAHVALAAAEQIRGRDTVLAGWLTRSAVLAVPAPGLEGVAVCLLDCDDDIGVSRIEARAASETWRLHTPGEVAGFLRAAAVMRTSDSGLFRVDTSSLSVSAIADRLEEWMARTRSGCS